ncbi:MAG: hypothetical protein KAS72_08465 [Phycisphaerales bacterium]|nr:hypothetical protein [Phycisphaerales bacterium]
MTSTAMLPPAPAPTTTAPQVPLLDITGRPAAPWWCRKLICFGLLDEREAIIDTTRGSDPIDGSDAHDVLSQLGREATVQWSWRVGDHGAHVSRWLTGEFSRFDMGLDPHSASAELLLKDRWSDVLDQHINSSWWNASDVNAEELRRIATMRAGPGANRSDIRRHVRGRSTYVFQEGGAPWTLRDAITYLSVTLDLNLDQILLPSEQLTDGISLDLRVGGSIRSVLTTLLERHGMYIDRTTGDAAARHGHRCRPIGRGRPITLTLRTRAQARSLIERIRCRLHRETQSLIVSVGPAREIEGTFLLLSTWDPQLEGESTSVYDRDHADFLPHAEVFRRWRLGEHEGLFDLAAHFGVNSLPPTPLAFRPRRGEGVRDPSTGVLVEYSLDSGNTWQAFTGAMTLAQGRGELLLTEHTLPSGFAAAGNAETLRLRIAAALRQPDVHPETRILGNVLCDMSRIRDASDEPESTDVPDDDDSDPRDMPGAVEQDDEDDDGPADAFTAARVGESKVGDKDADIVVDIGPVDPGVRIGDIVTAVRGGRSPAVCIEQSAGVSVVRIEHDLGAGQRTRVWLRPIRLVQ